MKLHMDLDCFFVSAERTRYPFLKNRPVVVAKGTDRIIFSKKKKQGVLFDYDMGAFNNSFQLTSQYNTTLLNHWREEFIDIASGEIHGIVIAKSYEAKKYKIKTGTPLKNALQMCPGLIVLPSDHLFYQTLSFKLKNYLETKIPLLEQYSIDEFFGDVNGWVSKEKVLEFIKELQADILQEFDLPISIAASKSKWIAKLATDTIKPYGCTVIEEDSVDSFTDAMPIESFPGIGRAIESKLISYGIQTLQEAKRVPKTFFAYGKSGKDLYKRILGIDNEPVIPSRIVTIPII
jgi:DNA polymerase-4